MFNISINQVEEAYEKVKANRGGAGIDKVDIETFEKDKENNLYKIWNRMSSGSYMPPPVRRVEIPKSDGKVRQLGIPTIGDRVAQMVVKMYLEPILEQYFHNDSYGYRPNKSAHQAVAITRKRCWKYPFVLDMDIKGFFDNIDHTLMMKALEVHTDEKWILLYIKRWLEAPVQTKEGLIQRDRGTPQGGVISPLLANLFLHYAFDRWMGKKYPTIPFARYADDIVCHCNTIEEAKELKKELTYRLNECKLSLHPEKTKIVYCKDDRRDEEYEINSFDFLGFTFQPRVVKRFNGEFFVGFNPAISNKASKAIRQKIRDLELDKRVSSSLEEISKLAYAKLNGWINYYRIYSKYKVDDLLRYFNIKLQKWAIKKFKSLKRSLSKAYKWLKRIAKREPSLFPHWSLRYGTLKQ